MLIVTVGMVSIAQLMAVTLRMQQLGRNQTEAVRLAQDKIDQMMSLDFDAAATIQIGGDLEANVADHFDTDVQGYTRRWVVAAGPDANPNLRELTMVVIPDLADRGTRTPAQLVTIIRRW